MEVVTRKVAELKFIERNTRIHSKKQISEYVRSLKMFGQFRPMIIDENNVVLAGNGLLAALKKMGAETADCYVMAGLSEQEKRKLMLADNKIFQLGEDDTFAFEETISELNGDVNIPGYGSELLQNLTADLKAIDNAMENADKAKSATKRTVRDKVLDEIICPQCGHKFKRSNGNAEKSKKTMPI